MTGAEVKDLQTALCDTFTLETLDEVIRTGLGFSRQMVAGEGNLRSITFYLVEAAEREGWTAELIEVVVKALPKAPALRQFCAAHGHLVPKSVRSMVADSSKAKSRGLDDAGTRSLAREGEGAESDAEHPLVAEWWGAGSAAPEYPAFWALVAEYGERYQQKHGYIKPIGLSAPVPLHRVFTAVHVVPSEYLRAFVEPDKMEAAFKEKGRRHDAFRAEKVQNGIDVANRHRFLNLLGAPGSGKSTFLQRLGQEALDTLSPGVLGELTDGSRGCHYTPRLLPVFLELRQCCDQEIDLTANIARELAECGIPDSLTFAEYALRRGGLLVLLDGLDEVPQGRLTAVIDHVRRFVDRHGRGVEHGNRFVTSCRTAHYKNYFTRFTDVVLADFDNEQIARFADNWFGGLSGSFPGAGKMFYDALRQPANAAALELARTPLLLTFLCLTYANGQDFPPTRATLYRRALELLLREWAAAGRIHDQPVHPDLNAELEVDMLAELAEPLFRADRFFFDRKRVTDHIRHFMTEQLKAPRSLNTVDVLEAIEIQQGLIVKRAEDVYSFSHMTIQEYLTAKQIWEGGEDSWRQLVEDNLADPRWHVVFELMAGMGKPDDLLRTMATRGARIYRQSLKAKGPRALARWAVLHAGKAGAGRTEQEAAAARSMLLAFALNLRARLPSAVPTPVVAARNRALDLAYALLLSGDRTLDRASKKVRELTQQDIRDRAHSLCSMMLINDMIDRDRFAFSQAAAGLKESSLSYNEVAQMLSIPELEPDPAGYTVLDDYVSVSLLLIRCKNASYRLAAATWDEVCRGTLPSPDAV